jgi:hypothetical protein
MSSTDETFRLDPPKWTSGEPIAPPFGCQWDDNGYAISANCKSCGVPLVKHLGLTGTCAKLIEVTAERDRLNQYVTTLMKTVETLETIINSNKD